MGWRRFALRAVLVLLVACLGACGGPSGEREDKTATPARLPEVTPLAAAQVRDVLAAHRGKVVLVNVWASWCLPCQQEFPDLLRAYRELAPRGLDLVLVSADFEAQREAAQRFLAGQGVDFPSFQKSGDDEAFINSLDARWSGALPATIVLGRDGRVAAFWEGEASYRQFKETVSPLL